MGWQRIFWTPWLYFYWPWSSTHLLKLFDCTVLRTAIDFLMTCFIARERGSGRSFTVISNSAFVRVHCFDSSMALQYWFWRELYFSLLLRIWPVWFLRDLFCFLLPPYFILSCHSWNNWHCMIWNWRDTIPKAFPQRGNRICSSLDKKLYEKESCWDKCCLKNAWKLWALGHLLWILLIWNTELK